MFTPPRKMRNSELVSDIKLRLHTPYAQVLFKGDWRQKKIGLIEFSVLTKFMWKSTQDDDPYAEWFLMQIYDQLQSVKDDIASFQSYCKERMDELSGIEMTLITNPNPVSLPLEFKTPFGYMAAELLGKFDYAYRQALTMKKIGIILAQEHAPSTIITNIRRLFLLSTRWKHTGVTRKDIIKGNERSVFAVKKMGELPKVILDQKIQSSILPKRTKPVTPID